jgi:hypothetical protein
MLFLAFLVSGGLYLLTVSQNPYRIEEPEAENIPDVIDGSE